jgi:hypothetical protein
MNKLITFESFDSVESNEGKILPLIFIAGLDTRSSDLSLEEQTQFVKTYLGNHPVKSFCNAKSCKRHDDVSMERAKKYFQKSPNSIILLFSSGTGLSQIASEFITDPKNLYILEPYPEAKKGILKAIDNGVPRTNIILGRGYGSGKGLINGASSTPSGYTHFSSLKYASLVISKRSG